MNYNTRRQVEILRERMTRAEKDIRACNENDRKLRTLIRQLDEALKIMVKDIDTLGETQLTILETQQKFILILKNHQVVISNLIKSPKAKKKFTDDLARYIS